MGTGLLGIIHLILIIWALVKIMQSGVSSGNKALWIVLVVLLPIIGFIIWLIAGPK
ncbi:PLDc N-terminal domain-containing protein [Aliidiomarina indica]|uniref:PLDc N-terminal domain-containing protein n=1 Tax=Aliidiomarina indica TaxID=2749147 RepID=UPI00188F4538|nr:PLDc N-terminal domain-containing protein [Aliidiomarina indica]